jgi:alpha-tubulin suppressor-like RCC1 family protein
MRLDTHLASLLFEGDFRMPRFCRLSALVATVATVAGLMVVVTAPSSVAAAPRSAAAGLTGSGASPGLASISLGSDNGCAVRTTGDIACWGDNSVGQSDGAPAPFTQVSVGDQLACAVWSGVDSIACWGHLTDDLNVPTDEAWRQVSVGSSYICGLTVDGTALCWGNGAPAGAPTGATFRQISAGATDVCGLQTDGTVVCWGSSALGPLDPSTQFNQVVTGDGSACGLETNGTVDCWGTLASPTDMFTQIAIGTDHGCGITPTGTASCWGVDTDGDATAAAGTFVAIAAGTAQSCGVLSDGTATCWGTGSQPPHYNYGHTQVSAGSADTCGVRTDGSAACWGTSPSGQPDGVTFTQIVAGLDHTCGVETTGIAACWGGDATGDTAAQPGTFTQVAVGDAYSCGIATDSSLSCWGDIATPPDGSFVDVSAGANHACAIDADSTAVCWGDDTHGQATAQPGTYTDISAGSDFSCGVHTDATIECWGDDTAVVAAVPLGQFSRVAAGDGFACGIKINTMVTCWGDDDAANIIDDAPTASLTQITAGAAHACGVEYNATVVCWGSDADGQTDVPNMIVAPYSQTLTFNLPTIATVDGSYTPTVTGMMTAGTTSLTSSTTTCSADAADLVKFVHVNTCTLTAHQPGDSDYQPADDVESFTINPGFAAIAIPVAPVDRVIGQTYTVVPSSKSDGTYGYSVDSATTGKCSVTPSGGVVSLIHAGACRVDVAQSAGADYVASNEHEDVVAGKADTRANIAVHASSVQATISVVSPGAGNVAQANSAQFYVDGKAFGARVNVNSSGVATLNSKIPTGKDHAVAVSYLGGSDFNASSGSTARNDPTISAKLSSTTAKSHYGWYRTPVTVKFTCAGTTASLATACPSAVTLQASKAAASLSRTIMATDGGAKTVTVSGINIDAIKPTVRVGGVIDGNSYLGNAPSARCLATDTLSGLASCKLTKSPRANGVTGFKATATDKAGNMSTTSGTYRVFRNYVLEAIYDASSGAYLVHTATPYTLVALATHQPRYYKPVVFGHRPKTAGGNLTRSGSQAHLKRWTRTVAFRKTLKTHRYWTIGLRINGTMNLIKLRIVR